MSDNSDSRGAYYKGIERLHEGIYGEWSQMVHAEAIIDGHDGVIFVSGKDAAELKSKLAARDTTKFAAAKAFLVMRVMPSQLVHMQASDPREVWLSLERIHRALGLSTRIGYRRSFLTARKGDDQSMQAWVTEVRRLAQLLESAGVDVDDEDVILVLTMGLPETYSPVVVSLDATHPDVLTVDFVIARLLNEEKRQAQLLTPDVPNNVALTAHHSMRGGPAGRGGMRGGMRGGFGGGMGRGVGSPPAQPASLAHITCFYCGEKGHYQMNCPHWQGYVQSAWAGGVWAADADGGDSAEETDGQPTFSFAF